MFFGINCSADKLAPIFLLKLNERKEYKTADQLLKIPYLKQFNNVLVYSFPHLCLYLDIGCVIAQSCPMNNSMFRDNYTWHQNENMVFKYANGKKYSKLQFLFRSPSSCPDCLL